MEYTGCKDAAFEVIDEASEEFGDSYFLNEEKYGKIEEICGLVDELMCNEDFGCNALTVDVDTTTKDLIFNIVCDDIVLQHGRSHKFFTLAGLVDRIKFSKAKPSSLRIEIGVCGLWLGGYVYE